MSKSKKPDASIQRPSKHAMQASEELIPKQYKVFLEDIKKRISSTQLKAARSVNTHLINLYWEIGNSILKKQLKEGWGAKTIEKLSKDLNSTFPGMKGFSNRNIQFMVQFAREYPEIEIVKQLVSQIPWGHNILLLQRLQNIKQRLWYANKTLEHGWSRNVLWHRVDSDLYGREGKAVTNFKNTLPTPQSDLAQQTLKDPYCFDFLNLREKHDEQELEDGLISHIQSFLIEIGQGFAFMGRQYPIKVGGEQFQMDLLFYHVKLRCFIVVELKARGFKPEDAGQLNFYLSAVDECLKEPLDNPTIGILLCKTRNKVVAEYAFRSINRPMGVVEYETMLTKAIPKNLKSSLPTIEEIEEELARN